MKSTLAIINQLIESVMLTLSNSADGMCMNTDNVGHMTVSQRMTRRLNVRAKSTGFQMHHSVSIATISVNLHILIHVNPYISKEIIKNQRKKGIKPILTNQLDMVPNMLAIMVRVPFEYQ